MKAMIGWVLAGVILAGVGGVAPVRAQAVAEADAPPALMTQGELAQLMVKKLGLFRQLPASPSDFECIMVLSQNGIFPSPTLMPTEQNPAPGWNLTGDAEVTLADLAVVLVRALGLVEEVEGDVADPQNWVNVLKNLQVPHESIGAGVAQMRPLDQVLVGTPIFQLSPDPLTKRLISESDTNDLFNIIQLPVIGATLPPSRRPREEGPVPKPATPTFPIVDKGNGGGGNGNGGDASLS